VSGDDEPFKRLFHQGMVLYNGEKMSKSRRQRDRASTTSPRRTGIDAMRLSCST